MRRNNITLTGEVTLRMTSRGSKSEHEAVMLESRGKHYTLRRKGGNAFHDPEMIKLVGKKIQGKGDLVEYVFIMEDWEIVSPDNSG
ncbi:MAG TPA: hypothetical protein VJT83_05300 [Chitinophagaceae bacterium]|nr:hypothetical protein [Chitinophagaceae bacterium]